MWRELGGLWLVVASGLDPPLDPKSGQPASQAVQTGMPLAHAT